MQVANYAIYQVQLESSYLARQTRAGSKAADLEAEAYGLSPLVRPPEREHLLELLGEAGAADLNKEAEEICSGKVRLFAGEPVLLNLGPARSDIYWTELERWQGEEPGFDLKLVWEPGRFGWAFSLARAYQIGGDERCSQVFWANLEAFLKANPPGFGYHWTSAQEVALRLIALSFAGQIFENSTHSTVERKTWFGRAIAAHAARIPPSMSYARAQNNNHLLLEAVGLYTAGVVLSGHPDAARWRQLGWRWSNKALQAQIAFDGAYVQQSTNYHRLMLQAALWLHTLSLQQGEALESASMRKLALATRWLLALLDPLTGGVPNLGPNDGANILPLTVCPFHDYRPVLQAASIAFLGERVYEAGVWDEMALWLPGQRAYEAQADKVRTIPTGRLTACRPLVLIGNRSWAYLRTARFTNRPGHADQLHLDLWWNGMNIALDAGTYLYNAEPPWDNALSLSPVHNIVTVNGLDQMTRAGRFLWLDWAQTSDVTFQEAADGTWQSGAALHDGYRRSGVLHRRVVRTNRDDCWLVEDTLSPIRTSAENKGQTTTARLHWLLPDWQWNLTQDDAKVWLKLDSPQGPVTLTLDCTAAQIAGKSVTLQLVRAGELLAGSGEVLPICGWYSPTYGVRLPALSLSLTVEARLPVKFETEWKFQV